MLVYFKNAVLVLLLCLVNWSIGIKAAETPSREKGPLSSKRYTLLQEKETDHKTPVKQRRAIEDKTTIKFRRQIDRVSKEFEGFESLPLQQQQDLLDKLEQKKINDWIVQAQFARWGMLKGGPTVSNETWEKLKKVQSYTQKKTELPLEENKVIPKRKWGYTQKKKQMV